MFSALIMTTLLSSSVIAAPTSAPKCCFIAASEFDAFAPTSQVCSKTGNTYSCPAGMAAHNKNHHFLAFDVPSANTGSSTVAFVAQCRDAHGKAITGKPILCEAGQQAQEMTWDASIMGSATCVETAEDPFRIVQFTPKTAGLHC